MDWCGGGDVVRVDEGAERRDRFDTGLDGAVGGAARLRIDEARVEHRGVCDIGVGAGRGGFFTNPEESSWLS